MRKHIKRARAMASLLVAVGSVQVVNAATDTWTGGGGTPFQWNNSANWGVAAPVATDSLLFDGNVGTTNSNNNTTTLAISAITFAPTAGSFVIGGTPINLTGDINDNATTPQSLGFSAVTTNTIPGGGLIYDGGTENVNVTAGGSLNMGNVTLGLVPASTNVTTLNVNNSATMANLTVQTKSTSANVISVASGQTLNVTGLVNIGTPPTVSGGGSINTVLNFTGGGNVNATGVNFFVGEGTQNLGSATDRNIVRMDMTALGSFTYNTGPTGTGLFGVGWSVRPDAQLKLSPGTNTIVAATIHVGDSQLPLNPTSASNNNGVPSTLFLGTGSNIINATSLVVGSGKASGTLGWVGANGTLTINGQAGAGSLANITVGAATLASFGGGSSVMSLAGHTVNVNANLVAVGVLAGATAALTTTDIGSINFDTGNFTANTVQIAPDSQTGNVTGGNGVHGSITVGTNASSTGIFTVNTAFNLGSVATTATTTARTDQATFNVSGGTATINSDITAISTNANVTINSILNLAGGSLNLGSHNVGSYAAPITSISLAGGLLNTSGTVVGKTISVSKPFNVSSTPTVGIANGGTLTNATGVSPLSLPAGLTLAGDAGTVSVNGGDVDALSGSKIAPGNVTATGNMQINGNVTLESGSTYQSKLSDNGSADVLNVSGALTLNGAVNLQIGLSGLGAVIGNTYTIANFGSLVGNETNFNVLGDGSRKTFAVVPMATTGNSIQVLVGGTGPMAVTYLGNSGSTWVAGQSGALTWKNSTTTLGDRFFNADAATFDDNSTNNGDVTISGTVQPSSLTVSAGRNYTFSGTGSIGGGGNLTKTGTGTLVLATNNTYTGNTDIQGGTLIVGNGAATGSLGIAATVTVSGTLEFNRTGNSTISTTINDSSNGAGSLIVAAGNVALTGTNGYTGATTIGSGALLKPANRNSLGSMSGGNITVQNGGTLDIRSIALVSAAPTIFGSTKVIHIAGTGVNNVGAITNSGGTLQQWAFQNITLDGDALYSGARMDIGRDGGQTRTLDLGNHTLTVNMTGSQPIMGVLAGTTVTPGNIVVTAGGFDPEGATVIPDTGGTITFNTGTFLQFFATTDGAVQRKMVFKGNNNIGSATTTNGIINSNMTLQGNVTFQAYSSGSVSATLNNPMTLTGNISESGGSFSITKQGVFTATLSGNNNYTGGTTVNGTGSIAITNGHALGTGPVTINTGSITTSAGFTSAMHQSALSIVSGAKLDLNDNDMIIDYATGAGAATAASIRGYLISGYANGAWNGATGIASTAAANDASHLTALGYADAADVGLTIDDGVSVPSKSVVVRYTYYGDSSLDGKVDIGNDFNLFLQGYTSMNPTSWDLGDYNYDGATNDTDFALFIDGISQQQGGSLGGLASVIAASPALSFAQRASLLSAVPEPSTIALLSVAICAVGHRRRRK